MGYQDLKEFANYFGIDIENIISKVIIGIILIIIIIMIIIKTLLNKEYIRLRIKIKMRFQEFRQNRAIKVFKTLNNIKKRKIIDEELLLLYNVSLNNYIKNSQELSLFQKYDEDKIIVGFDDIKFEVDNKNKILKYRLFIYNFNLLPIKINFIEFKINNSPFLKDIKPFCINREMNEKINYYPQQYNLKREIIDSDNFLNAIELFIQSTNNENYYYSQGHLNIELEMSLSYNGENKTKIQNLYPFVLLEDKSEVIKNIKTKKTP